MFDKKAYWNNRKEGRSGTEKLEGKVYPKGTDVTRVKISKDGPVEVEVPNARGSHLLRVAGKGLQYVSRKESRRVMRDRHGSAKRYGRDGFSHSVNVIEREKVRPPSVSNHIAHRERQLTRHLNAERRRAVLEQAKETK